MESSSKALFNSNKFSFNAKHKIPRFNGLQIQEITTVRTEYLNLQPRPLASRKLFEAAKLPAHLFDFKLAMTKHGRELYKVSYPNSIQTLACYFYRSSGICSGLANTLFPTAIKYSANNDNMVVEDIAKPNFTKHLALINSASEDIVTEESIRALLITAFGQDGGIYVYNLLAQSKEQIPVNASFADFFEVMLQDRMLSGFLRLYNQEYAQVSWSYHCVSGKPSQFWKVHNQFAAHIG